MRAGFLDITPCKQLSSTYSRPIRKQIDILDQSDGRLTLIDAERARSSARSKFQTWAGAWQQNDGSNRQKLNLDDLEWSCS